MTAPDPARERIARAAETLRPEVLAFALLMEERLRANEHKGGWKGDGALSLARRAREELVELDAALDCRLSEKPKHHPFGTSEIVGKEAADVANFAMMVADVCGALPSLPPSPESGEGGGERLLSLLREVRDELSCGPEPDEPCHPHDRDIARTHRCGRCDCDVDRNANLRERIDAEIHRLGKPQEWSTSEDAGSRRNESLAEEHAGAEKARYMAALSALFSLVEAAAPGKE